MFDNLSNVKEKAQLLLAECAEYAEKNNSPKEAQMFKDLSDKNEEMIYQIAIIGFMKRGKSTLLNVLLGRGDTVLAPVKSAVCTATITKYLDVSLHPQQKETALVEFKDGYTQEISYEELNGYINNKQNNDNEKNVKCIRVYGHFPLVRSSVAIVDTPGKGSVHKEHDIIAEEFLPIADAIILAQAVDLPMDADEKQFLSSLPDSDKRKIITVLTKVDSVDEKDKRASCDFVQKELLSIGVPCNRVYCTAARTVLDARKEGKSESDVARIARTAGITDLENAIIDLITKNSNQKGLMEHHLRTIDGEIKNYIEVQKLSIEEAQAGFTKNVAELEAEKAQLIADKKTFEKNNEVGRKKFEKEWNRAVDRFCNRLENQKKQQIIDRLTNSVENAGMMALLKKPKQLPAQVSSMVGTEISDALGDLEEQLEKVVVAYSEDMDDGIELYANKTTSANNASQLMSVGNVALTGAGIAVAANYGITAIASQAAAISGAWGTAATAAGNTAFYSSWLGTQAAATAAATHTAAITATVTGVATMAGISLFALVGTKLALGIAKNIQAGNVKASIPKLVDSTFDKVVNDIKNQLDLRKNEIASAMSNYVEDELEKRHQQLDIVISSISQNDPSYKQQLEDSSKQLDGIHKKYIELKNSLGRL